MDNIKSDIPQLINTSNSKIFSIPTNKYIETA